MKFLNYLMMLSLLGMMASCGPEQESDSTAEPVKLSSAQFNYTSETPQVDQPLGSSAIQSVNANTSLTSYIPDVQAHQADSGQALSYTVNLTAPSMVQLVVQATAGSPDISLLVYLDGDTTVFDTLRINKDYVVSGVNEFNFGNTEIPRTETSFGDNTVKLVPLKTFNLRSVQLLPRDLYSKDGVLSTTIYSQFAKVDNIVAGSIWTRAYGLSRGVQMIPGPSLRFKPGDLLEVDIINDLNGDRYADLHVFDSIQNATVGVDEELANVSLHGEINVPHNLNNTNLHVHGLHVDPDKDDVTIVIVPEGASTADYDAPHQDHPGDAAADPDALNEFSVADQSVKAGRWKYQYKIPETHLPGTHWFHPHKHGATSAQVENGMAGTIVIEETIENSVIPYTPDQQEQYDAWYAEHDRVLAVQEITNYGLQFGKGVGGQESIVNAKGNLTLTVNGYPDYKIRVEKGQIERWRVVNAGTNHRSFSHVWLGKKIPGKQVGTYANAPNIDTSMVYQSVPMYMVAVDGVTIPDLVEVTAEKPSLLSPGNRTDFLVQFPDSAKYIFFKNYAVPKLTILSTDGTKVVYSNTTNGEKNFGPAQSSGKQNPLIFPYTYTGNDQKWKGTQSKNNPSGTLNVLPLIRTKVSESDANFIDLDFETASAMKQGVTGWTASGENSKIIADTILSVHVSNTPAGGFPTLPSTSHMQKISPVTSGKAPSYASPINPTTDVLQSRPIIFDISGIQVNVTDSTDKTNPKTTPVKQFTLNGRFFELNDGLGNLNANDLIKKSYLDASELEFESDSVSDRDSIKVANEVLAFQHSNAVEWPDPSYVEDSITILVQGAPETIVTKNYYFTNPGYYRSFDYDQTTGEYAYATSGSPDWKKFSGLDQMAVVNTGATKYSADLTLPSLPRATTAEEYYLINNSDVGHPFHIHISPFFVVEVGQLSFETDPSTGNNDWFMRTHRAASEPALPAKSTSTPPGSTIAGTIGVQGIVGNWWDTIVIPPHGYVKVRYWLNVPNQTGTTPADIVVTDDYDKSGIWVYHCHILRHEDRGMMMPVITQPLKE